MITVVQLLEQLNLLLADGRISGNDIVMFGSHKGSFGEISVSIPRVIPNLETVKEGGTLMFCDKFIYCNKAIDLLNEYKADPKAGRGK